MDATRITQAIGVLLLGVLLVALAIQVVGDAMWHELGRDFVQLSVT